MFSIAFRCLVLVLAFASSSTWGASTDAYSYRLVSVPAEEAPQQINELASQGWQVKGTALSPCAGSASPGTPRRQDCLLVTFEKPVARVEHDDGRTTYVLDQDLVRFAKFSIAVLAVFLVVGAYLFGFKLESALEKVRNSQAQLKELQQSLLNAQKDLEAAQSTVRTLKQDVERVLAEATGYVGEISEQKVRAFELTASIRELTPPQNANLEEVKATQPDRFRSGGVGKFWPTGTTLKVRFLGGTERKRREVRKIAEEWTRHANIHFDFVSDGDAEIRVAFTQDNSVWSYLGTDAMSVPKSEPTMNLAWVDKSTVLQHFGHALGLIKEHQNPKATIPWNKKVVYRELTGAPNHWSRKTVDQNVFSKYAEEDFPDYREFDPHSIMMNQFSAEWAGGQALGGAQDLSESDKALIAKLYPPEGG